MAASVRYRTLRTAAVAVAAVTLPLALAVPGSPSTAAASGPTWGKPEIVGIDPKGRWVPNSMTMAIGGGGRIVLFSVRTADSDEPNQLFVRDRTLRKTTRVDVSSTWQPANGPSWTGVTTTTGFAAPGWEMSANGRFVVFSSDATNLVPGDTNRQTDVFLRDLWTFTTRRVSVAKSGLQGNGPSRAVSVSDDGNLVAFDTDATNLYRPDRNGTTDVLVKRVSDGQLTRVDETAAYAQASDTMYTNGIAMSADGRYVAFRSDAMNLRPNANHDYDIYVKDRWTGRIDWVSRDDAGRQLTGAQYRATTMSRDGRIVLMAGGNEVAAYQDVVDYRDRTLGRTIHLENGTSLTTVEPDVAISGDGRFLAYDHAWGACRVLDRWTGRKGNVCAGVFNVTGSMIGGAEWASGTSASYASVQTRTS